MNKSLVAAIAVAGSVGLLAAIPSMAQRPQPPGPPRTGTAMLDTGVIMKDSNRFNAAMERLKAQYESKAEELKKEGERGNQMAEEMQQLPKNSPKKKELERQLMQMRADWELKGKRITEDIREMEAKIVLGLMTDIKAELERYGKATGTELVLRDNPEPPNLTDPRIILQEIHKPIVYQSGGDITSIILDTMNRGTAAPTAGRPAARR